MRYNEVFRSTNSEQLLMNIVRLRYAESPVFVDLPNITSQFEVSGRGNFLGGYGNQNPGPSSLGFGELDLRDTPTLSYHPREGREIAKALLTPISTDLLSVVNGGANVEQLLLLTINDINDVPNAPRATTITPQVPDHNNDFVRGIRLLAAVRDRDGTELAVGTTEEPDASDPVPAALLKGADLIAAAKEGYAFRSAGDDSVALRKRERDLYLMVRPNVAGSDEMREIAQIFGLNPGLDHYRVKSELDEEAIQQHRLNPLGSGTIYLNMRSVLQIMTFLSKGVCVPEEHVRTGIAPNTIEPDGRVFNWTQVTAGNFLVHADRRRPKNAEVAVRYRGYWFYIASNDVRSRASLSILSMLLALQDSDTKSTGPLLTLPLGGG